MSEAADAGDGQGDPQGDRVLGVNMASGIAYLALVAEASFVATECDRISPAASLVGSRQLRDFRDRFRQEARRVDAASVAVMHPKLYAQWKYADAFTRVSLEAAIMLMCEDMGIRYISVRYDARAARAAGVPLATMETALRHANPGVSVTYWKARHPALFAALAAAGGYGR